MADERLRIKELLKSGYVMEEDVARAGSGSVIIDLRLGHNSASLYMIFMPFLRFACSFSTS